MMFESTSQVYDPQTGLWTPAHSHEGQFQGRASAFDDGGIYYSDMAGFFKDERDALAIESERGFSIVVDRESRLVSRNGLEKARRLKVGDSLATPRLLQSFNNRPATEHELTSMLIQIVETQVVPPEAFMLPQQQTVRLLHALTPRMNMFKYRDVAEDIQKIYMRVGLAMQVRKYKTRFEVRGVKPEGADGEIYWDEIADIYEVGSTEVWGTTVMRDHNLCVNGFFVEDA